MINAFGPRLGPEEAEAVRDCLRRSWMGMGPKVKEFEEAFAKYRNLPGLVMTDSGSNALLLAVTALALKPDSEIILPTFTWVACANSVVGAGHRPVFCDVDPETQNVTVDTIRPHVTKNTRAIMVVHYAGLPVDVPAIKAEFGLPVIEDAAHAVCSSLGGVPCGALGDVAIFSFDAVKNLATPEGGGLTGREDLMDEARLMRYCGLYKSGFDSATGKWPDRLLERWWDCHIYHAFPKTIPNDVSAAIGLCQLAKLADNQRRRKEIWDTYQREFDRVEWLARPPEPAAGQEHSYFTYFVRVKNGTRDRLAKHLLGKGVYTTLRFPPLHLASIYQNFVKLPNAEWLAETGLNLPLHPGMSDEDVAKVVGLVENFTLLS